MGRGTEPTAEGHIWIEVQAGKPQAKAFNIPTIIGTSTEYKVGLARVVIGTCRARTSGAGSLVLPSLGMVATWTW